MKQIFGFFGIFITLHLSAQTPFAGKVVYNMHTLKEKDDAGLTVFFGTQKLRLEFSEKGKKANNDVIIVALDSGTVIHLNHGAKTYRVKPLAKRDLSGYKNKQIAGYATAPQAAAPTFNDGYSQLFSQSVFFVASDLYYPVPDVYKGNTELIVISDNKVVLGAEILMGSNAFGHPLTAQDSLEIEQGRISVEAVDVKAYQPEAQLFAVPADFTLEQTFDYNNDSTTAVAMDSVFLSPPALPKKKTSKPVKKKSVGKASALRRKEK